MQICSCLHCLTDMELVLASRNKKKIAEMNTLLAKYCGESVRVLSLDDIGFEGDIVEDGNSFYENAVIKASAPASLGYIGIADDSGLCVDALGGAPGIYSARYSGEGATDAKNNEKLLRELESVSERGGAFYCAIACVIPEGSDVAVCDDLRDCEADKIAENKSGRKCSAFVTVGKCPGEILRDQRGEGGFGYDPLFYVPSKEKTFSELSAEEKNEISHRGVAMRSFGERIKKLI